MTMPYSMLEKDWPNYEEKMYICVCARVHEMNEEVCIGVNPVKQEPCGITFPTIKEELKDELLWEDCFHGKCVASCAGAAFIPEENVAHDMKPIIKEEMTFEDSLLCEEVSTVCARGGACLSTNEEVKICEEYSELSRHIHNLESQCSSGFSVQSSQPEISRLTSETRDKDSKQLDYKTSSFEIAKNASGSTITEKPFQCSFHSAQFSEKSSLNLHIRTQTDEKPFQCPFCSAKFTRKCALSIHVKTHTEEKDFHCSLCSAKFTRKCALSIHMRTHTGEKPFHCSSCSAKFTRRCDLNLHMRTHTGEQPFECPLCSAKFSHKGHLYLHMRIHPGEKNFQCSLCSAKYFRKDHLCIHMRRHTGEKPFQCSLCSAKFSQKSCLNRHMRIH